MPLAISAAALFRGIQERAAALSPSLPLEARQTVTISQNGECVKTSTLEYRESIVTFVCVRRSTDLSNSDRFERKGVPRRGHGPVGQIVYENRGRSRRSST